jgi:huntingtin interacting protein 1
VAEATAQVIATSRACYSAAENEGVDLEKLSFHQTKRMEMEIQIKVLELETQLQRERQKLFSLRKRQYAANNADNEEVGDESTA